MSDFSGRPGLWTLAGALCLLTPFLYAYGFCYPRGDDFDFAVKAMWPLDLAGGLYETGREWLTWSGRFSFHFLAVFFGAATENRLFGGLVCASVAALFVVGAALVLRSRLDKRSASVGAVLSTLALFAFYQNLPDFYLYTDCLSIVLQEALFAVFLGLFLRCLGRLRAGKSTKGCFALTVGSGIFAAGVYEHAAFAIAWTILATLVFSDWKNIRKNSPAGAGELKRLAFFIYCGICLSLFAPGNFARGAARPVDPALRLDRLTEAPAEWAEVLADFAAGFGLWGFLILGVFLASFQRPREISLRAAFAVLIAFCGFSLTIVSAQALSDAPFSSSPKFPASLGFYAAVAEITLVFVALSRLGEAGSRLGRSLKAASLCLFFLLVVSSENFRATALNALNGDMASLAEFMREREETISLFSNPSLWPERGLIGEIKNPRAREAAVNPELEPVALYPVPYPVFPVYMKEALAMDANAWPNPYAAWARGVPALLSRPTDAEAVIGAARRGEGLELRVPPELPWLAEARIIPLTGRTGAALALKFADADEREIEILRPSAVFAARPLPLFFQEKLLNWLLEKKDVRYSPLVGATATLIRAHTTGKTAVLPLRSDRGPDAIFIKDEGDRFFRLLPWLR